jgi:hypothetical protein
MRIRKIKIGAAERLDVDWNVAQRMRAVDDDGDACRAQLRDERGHGQHDGGVG